MSRPINFAISQNSMGGYDYLIGGVSLAERFRKHERQTVDHMSALGVVDGTRGRLLLEAEPDLVLGVTALYVCGICGGYDGSPIGARLRKDGDLIIWDELGYHYDYEEAPYLFKKVTSFVFDWQQYKDALLAVSAT